MSRNIFVTILLITFLTLAGFLFFQSQDREEKILSEIAPTITPTPVRLPYGKIIDLDFNSQFLRILAIEISASSSMSLIPNFSERFFGEDIVASKSCDIAINGGFYKSDHTPLGLFMTGGEIIGKEAKSSVANGFFWQDKTGIRQTSPQAPFNFENLDFILQSGPYVRVRDRRLNLINDASTRRSVIGEDNERRLYFISMITRENNYSGPYLADIPVIFSQPEVKQQLPLTTLLNLDGGGASFFHSKDEINSLTLSSFSPIGSLLCVRL